MGNVLICLLSAVLFQAVASAQSPPELVDRMVRNELAAPKSDNGHWMYQDSQSQNGITKVEEVIETAEGSVARLASVNGRAPTASEQKKNQEEIHKLLTDASYRKQQHDKAEQDGKKATQLLAMLPRAFLYQDQGRDGAVIRLSFRPNPAFHPPTPEAKVFHGMAGILLIDSKQTRLVKLAGHLTHSVNFGGGLLGKLKKGSTFEVDQADVGAGHWELTKLDVHISGHALLFATIKEQQHEIRSGFREVAPGTTLAKAAQILNHLAPTANGD